MAEYKIDDTVRIKTGPFASFVTRVEDASPGNEMLTVVVRVFGRATPIRISSQDVERADPGEDHGRHFQSNN